ncbi:MAG: hypothetical protein HYV35_02855 [Lentisphaerae bacterium]|nr:hypothetical protein [Lentisphaerota bacterium]
MKKILVVLISTMMLAATARGGIYRVADDWLGNMFVVNTAGGFMYKNQFVMLATLTDSGGNYLPDKALVLFDMANGNVNLILFGFSCTISYAWNLGPASALLGYIGDNPRGGDIFHLNDSISLQTVSSAQPYSRSGQETGRNGGADVSGAAATAATVSKTPSLVTGFGDSYFLDTLYEVYPSIYVFTMTVQNANGVSDGLLFFQQIPATAPDYFVIVTVFESASLSGYSMVGLYNPDDAASRSHYFVVLARSGGSTTTLY